MADHVERLVALQTSVKMLDKRRAVVATEIANTEKILAELGLAEMQSGEASQVLKKVAEICEMSSKKVMEQIVNHGLQAIFDEPDTFTIEMETKARAVYAYMRLGGEANIVDSRGGGYVDIISVLTVVVLILQQRKDMRRFIVLDEAFAEVGREHLEKVGQFLKFLVEKLGIVILLVTHAEELLLYANNVYEFSLADGATQIKKRKLPNV